MNLIRRLKNLSLSQIFKAIGLFLPQPVHFIIFLKATNKTLEICNTIYPKKHQKNTFENAFRHALWNFILVKMLFESNKNEEKSMKWAKKITDLHEQIYKNNPLHQAMDLHNNNYGIQLFKEKSQLSIDKAIEYIKNQRKNAIFTQNLTEIKQAKNQLVYTSLE